MSKKKTKEKSLPIKYIIPAIILIMVVVFVLGSYGVKLIKEAKNRVTENYFSIANGVSYCYDKEIYAIEQATEAVAEYSKDSEDIFDEKNIRVLKSVVDTLSVSNAYFVNNDYSAMDTNGNYLESITQLPGYSEAFKGTNTITEFIKNADGENVMLICSPISTKVEMKGYILAEYRPNVMDKLLQSAEFSPQNSYGLLSPSGIVIENIGAKSPFVTEGNNMLDTTGVTINEGSLSILKQTITKRRRDSFVLTKGAESEYVYICPVSKYDALVVVAVDERITKAGYEKASKSVIDMIRAMCIIIGAFLIVLLIIEIFNKARFSIESEDLQNKADTDQLTDLYNKMATERLIKEYLEGEGKDSTSMLFLLDIDNFKKINDTMGHAFGDEVLSNLGHQIRAWFRVNDIVGRIGGDEFMVFIKDIKDVSVVKREGSRIMQFFEGFQVGDYTKYSPTASIGGAVFPNDAKDFESLYKAADKAVYKAKKEGKNRVAFYGDLNKTEQETEPDKTGRD